MSRRGEFLAHTHLPSGRLCVTRADELVTISAELVAVTASNGLVTIRPTDRPVVTYRLGQYDERLRIFTAERVGDAPRALGCTARRPS